MADGAPRLGATLTIFFVPYLTLLFNLYQFTYILKEILRVD
jgi:hypothetical protein